LDSKHTERLVRARQWQVLSSGGWKRVGPKPCGPAMVENPLGDRKISAFERPRDLHPLQIMQPPVRARQQHSRAACKALGHVFDGDGRQVAKAACRSEFPAHRVEQRGPAFAGAGDSRLRAHIRDKVGDDERHHQHRGKRHEVLKVTYRKAEPRRYETEIECGDVSDRSEAGGATSQSQGRDGRPKQVHHDKVA